jgi:quercetin dioxygenase-like cupin family protein
VPIENMRQDIRQVQLSKAPEAAQQGAIGECDSQSRSISASDTGAPHRLITNPISGEQIIIHTSGAETNGALLIFDLFLPPGKHVPSWHMHPIQEERFTILAGAMRFRLGWRSILATHDTTIVVSPGVAHWFGNAGPAMVHARVEVRPALQMEALFATAATMEAEAQPSIGDRVRQLLAIARLLIKFRREVAVPSLAAWLVRPALAVVARLDRHFASADIPGPTHDRS